METQTSLLLTVDAHAKEITWVFHDHPLTLCEIDNTFCSICCNRCLGPTTYGCTQCRFFLHESCTKIEIPQEIDHHFHPHPLKLVRYGSRNSCKFCSCSSHLMFECGDCEFYMDVECALFPTKLNQDGCSTIDHIQHFQHPHPLTLFDDQKKYVHRLCLGCNGELSKPPCFSSHTYLRSERSESSSHTSLLSEGSESVYGCLHLPCGFFLHEYCARLPLKIESPFHPGHSLQLNWSSIWSDQCHACVQLSMKRCMYKCPDSCKFFLGVECAFLSAPILKLESHNHLLTLFPSINPKFRCEICNEACDSSNIFRCIDCNYNLHLHCGPLPCSIKDKCHIDPLKLTYDFVEDGYEDDIVYCDACEQPRDPNQCVYYCRDCNFIAELKCVEAEVLCSLNGERGNVKLNTANKTRIRIGAQLTSYVITDNVETDSEDETEDIGAKYLEVELHENLFSGSYTDEECEQLIEIFHKARVELNPSTWLLENCNEALCAKIKRHQLALKEFQSKGKVELESDEESNNGENTIVEPYSDNFKQVMRMLDSYYGKAELIEVFFQEDYNIVRIGEHMIVQDSASVLKGLLHKYGDFTAKSKLSQRLKAIFLTLFCEVICWMCLKNVREVDYVLLQQWWKSFKLAQHAGFEIQFAIDQLYKVVQASFGRQAITSYHKKKSEVDKISNQIERAEAELKAKKSYLEELKSDVEKDKYAIEYQSSPVLKECLKHESELKWKKAWDGSPIMFR